MNLRASLQYNRYKDAYKVDLARMDLQQIKIYLYSLRFMAKQMYTTFYHFYTKMSRSVSVYRPGTLELHAKILEYEAIIQILREDLDKSKIDYEILQQAQQTHLAAPEVDLTPLVHQNSLENTIRSIQSCTELYISQRSLATTQYVVPVDVGEKCVQCDILNYEINETLILQLKNDISQLQNMYEQQKSLNMELQQQIDQNDGASELIGKYLMLDKRNAAIIDQMRNAIRQLSDRDQARDARITELRVSGGGGIGGYELQNVQGEITSLKNAVGKVRNILLDYKAVFGGSQRAAAASYSQKSTANSGRRRLDLSYSYNQGYKASGFNFDQL